MKYTVWRWTLLTNTRCYAVLSALLIAHSAIGTVCHTISSGVWSDPLIWDCGCDPADCDTLYIGHEVTAPADLVVWQPLLVVGTSGSLHVEGRLTVLDEFRNEGILFASEAVQASISPRWENDGYMDCGLIHFAGDSILNHGVLVAHDTLSATLDSHFINLGRAAGGFFRAGGTYNYDTLVFEGAQVEWFFGNVGYFEVQGLMTVRGSMSNDYEAYLICDSIICFGYLSNNSLIAAATLLQFGTTEEPGGQVGSFTADARIECGNLKNHAHIQGSGDICVQDSSINYATGVIDQSPDICDATLTTTVDPFLDVNLGFVGAAVRWCPQTTCTTGVGIREELISMSLYPVPASDAVYIQLPATLQAMTLKVFDMNGRESKSMELSGERSIRLDRGSLRPGLYQIGLYDHEGRLMGTERIVFLTD